LNKQFQKFTKKVKIYKKSFNPNDLLNTSFSHWFKLNDKLLCEHREENDMLFKNEITLIKQIIIMHFHLKMEH